MQNNYQFLLQINKKDIPWGNLCGPYERASNFPNLFDGLMSETAEEVKKSAKQLATSIEHQGTLWSNTPFAMVCLYQILAETVKSFQSEPSALKQQRIISVLELFFTVFETADGVWEMERETPLSNFTDMLDPQYLLPDYIDDDEDEYLLEEFFTDISPRLFYSFFHYSWFVVACAIKYQFPILAALQNSEIDSALKPFDNKKMKDFILATLPQ